MGIVAARDSGLLREHRDHINITKAWAKFLLKRMGYVKRKRLVAGKSRMSHFQEGFITDVSAEVVMNEIPHDQKGETLSVPTTQAAL